ncbi:hypothetical protein Forpe1208_v008347 [Fusarium oxysporum f. sp. rapae]|uniref:Uncharacterized protein n=1 Tax=Fusarium oxysporum f. sp. rapae TaxID=485398 RepID=A0A8J5U7K4_FUSOX|nr:hypothetical protein Forpe1208_v008347 [Fusarium oxysporum f. sp. rapae]
MKCSTVLSLTATFTGYVLADTPPTCSTTGDNTPITSTCCPRAPSKRLRRSAREIFARADSPTCPTPEFYGDSCCTHEFAKPTLSQGTFNLQCGANAAADTVKDAVKVEIVGCDTVDDLTKDSCYLMISSTPAGTITDTHLEISTTAWTSTKYPTKDPASWSYNSYCVKTTGVCQVPFNKIGDGASALCDKSLYIAYHTSTTDGTTSKTCTGDGTLIPGQPGNRWWEYLTLSFTCPQTCDGWCCCPSNQPPSTQVCPLGTAMGYGDGAINLNGNPVGPALSGQGCNRWGWYFTPSKASLQAGISGDLIVGAGGNDVNKGTYVGTWSATLVGSQLNFEYHLYDDNTKGHFDLAEVHVYAACVVPSKCAPGQYTFVDETLTGNSDTSFMHSIPVDGTCSTYYLIFHAKVNQQILSTGTCPDVVP